MEDHIFFKTLTISFALLILHVTIKFVHNFWWRPKRIEQQLRQQGVKGTSYKFWNGDMPEMIKSAHDASSKPTTLNHHIVPQVIPFLHQMVQQYGNVWFFWFGRSPCMLIGDAELVRFILTNKNGHFIKPPRNPLVNLLQLGVATLEGEIWSKRRRLVASAFLLEKLKPLEAATEREKKIFELQHEQALLMREAYFSTYIPGFRKEQAMKTGAMESHDLLSLLLQSKEESNNSLTIDDVIEECKLFYFAGQETTANLLTWTMIVLSMHPNWQDKARAEVFHICGKTTPDFQVINRLKIVSMVIHEVLRLYPPVPYIQRYTTCETRVGSISIPAGVELQLPFMHLHYDKRYWDNPEEFNPERFSEGVSKASHDQVAFYSFGWGPKICLGQNFAIIEAKMALAMILQHFSYQLSPSYAHAPRNHVTLKPQHGAQIIIHSI